MKVLLTNRKIFKVSGRDANNFLQSQLTNDINIINSENIVQINAYCQHQGKILSLIWLFKYKNEIYISFTDELAELVISKFNLYKMMSEVVFKDFSEKIKIYGLIDEEHSEALKILNNISILLSEENIQVSDYVNWEMSCIRNMLPEIYPSTSEKFIPQALNLDISEFGVSFTKGCYPGQEVVARMHYLGEPKRRLFRFTSRFEVLVGDSLNVTDSKSLKSSGQVIRAALVDGEFHFLGVFEVNHINDKIFLNKDQNKLVSIIHE